MARYGLYQTSRDMEYFCSGSSSEQALKGKVMKYRYIWYPKNKYKDLHGQTCRIIATGRMGSALVEFEDGHFEVISRRALRRISSDTKTKRFIR